MKLRRFKYPCYRTSNKFTNFSCNDFLYYSDDLRIFAKFKYVKALGVKSEYKPCKSVRAFRRHLRKMSCFVKTEVLFILVNQVYTTRYNGNYVYGKVK